MKKKFCLTLLIVFGLAEFIQAQNLNIYFYDSTSQSFALQELRALTFSNDSLNVITTSGVTHSWAFSFVDYYDYKESKTSSIPWKLGNNIPALLVYPNPSPGVLNLQFAIPSVSRGSTYYILIYDQNGRTVLNQSNQSTHGKSEKKQLDLQALANGSYICEVRMNSYTIKQSFILSK